MESKDKKKGKIIPILVTLGIIIILVVSVTFIINRGKAKVYYKSYTKEYGWTKYFKNGKTNGKDKGIKAIQFKVKYSGSGFVVSRIFANGKWSESVYSEDVNGNEKDNITAIRLALTDDLYKEQNICYRVHNTANNWLGWACNGANAGSDDFAIDKLEVKIIPKDKKYSEELKDYDSNKESYIENTKE